MSLGKIAIVGAGAIGSYYGARLVEAGEDVTFLLRSDYDHVAQHGLEISSVVGDLHLNPVEIARSSEEIGVVDLVIVAWKTTSNEYSQEVLTPLIGKNTNILTLQNGLGNCEHLAELFGSERVIGGLCFVCINRLSPGVIAHTAAGLIRIGKYEGGKSPLIQQIAETLQRAKVPCEVVDSLDKALWMKLVWNIPFNGLAIAEGGVDTEVLLHTLKLEGKVRAIMQEVLEVAATIGHDIPQNFIDQQIEITIPMEKYRPSSMIDFVEGRPVEYEAIWENPLMIAKRLQVKTPEIENLAQRIKQQLDLRD